MSIFRRTEPRRLPPPVTPMANTVPDLSPEPPLRDEHWVEPEFDPAGAPAISIKKGQR